MPADPRVRELLKELLESRGTPEEVCRACPELLPQVRAGWQRLRALQIEVGAMFPEPTSSNGANGYVLPSTEVPQICGYDVQEVLGRGGMGIVYKAWHLRLNRLVALKMLLAGTYAAPHERARFQREAQAVARLKHANIVQVYDVGDSDGRPYFTMEYLESGSLSQSLAGAPQPSRDAAEFVATLAMAVQAAHESGIVHRDLKPANILLAEDGAPKITDFGIARQQDDGAGLTQTGIAVGTPSYMAPEQVIGTAETIGPAADIYGLGAILYEMLTGRPPFRGETAAETERQVIHDEPVPPSRLNTRVPRDLETICLKCLNKDPQRRYASASALLEDLQRFQRNEPIAARPPGLAERAAKWVRRHPTHAAILAASLVVAILLVGGGFWLALQQAHRRNGVETDLTELARLQGSARWAEARAALWRAETWYQGGGPDDLRLRIAQARRDLNLVIKLDTIRLERATRGELAFYKARANSEYLTTFESAGLGTSRGPPSRVASLINASAVRGALVDAVCDWALCAGDEEQRNWLLEVARQTDNGSQGWRSPGWRDRALDPAAWHDVRALAELARTAPVADESVSLLLSLGQRLWGMGGDAAMFLRHVQAANPADFWANLIAGNALVYTSPHEAAAYYRAALASRPQAAVGYCAVGAAVRFEHYSDLATDYYRKAIELDPGYVPAYNNLGDVLRDQGKLDEAIDYYRRAVQLDPEYLWAHLNLAHALRSKGQFDEAHDQFLDALRVDPENWPAQEAIRTHLLRNGRGREARLVWQKALKSNPVEHSAWFGYAELCLFLEEEDEYHRACRDLLERFAAVNDLIVAERVGRTCLLRPASDDELRRGVALADLAVAARESAPEWVHPYFLFAKGLAEYRQNRLESAMTVLSGPASTVMGPSPRLLIAMAQHRLGQTQTARRTLAAAVGTFDWSVQLADQRDFMIWHIFRREAESLILPDLPAFLQGSYQPQDNDERLALMGICQFKDLRVAMARLYAAAFADDPGLADDLQAGRRYSAACSAALAGCGAGADGLGMSAEERRHWRDQAREWLRADLAAWDRRIGDSAATDGALVAKLMTWRVDPALAGLRERRSLELLPADEREACLTLWNEVDALLNRTRTPH
jgi:eukaryotic-like serine/threonine-protein kinase